MSKKQVLIVVLIVILVGVCGIFWFSNFKRVSFVFSGDKKDIVLVKDDREVDHFSNDKSVWLRKGEYELNTKESDYAVMNSAFDVNKSAIINIDVIYSDRKLEELLTSEVKGKLDSIIYEKYPEQMRDFVVKEGKLFWHAEWYGVILETKTGQADGTSLPYRVVMSKNGGVWKMVGIPELVLTTNTHPNVPYEILSEINKLAL